MEMGAIGSVSDDVKLGFWERPPESESSENKDNAPGLEDRQHSQITEEDSQRNRVRAARKAGGKSTGAGMRSKCPEAWS